MSRKFTRLEITRKAEQFINCNSNRAIEATLQLPQMQLAATAFSPQYYYFKIPKSKGGFREIEAPELYLKKIQRKINDYLQFVYYTMNVEASHGFVINPKRQKPKNIVSNASKHIGNDYMLNVDFDDFFHQISQQEVYQIFTTGPFDFSKTTANTLAKICTNKGRLPMGAPTSPALSNFACIDLDNDLQKWAEDNAITYTRFVDDLSFSSKKPISRIHLQEIIKITDKYELRLKPTKTKFYGKNQTKSVTGIVVGQNSLSIDEDYYKELNKDLERLQKTVEVHIITGQIYKADALKKFKQEVMGKINFIAIVMGYDSNIYQNYLSAYEDALDPPEKEALSARWTRFSNYTNI